MYYTEKTALARKPLSEYRWQLHLKDARGRGVPGFNRRYTDVKEWFNVVRKALQFVGTRFGAVTCRSVDVIGHASAMGDMTGWSAKPYGPRSAGLARLTVFAPESVGMAASAKAPGRDERLDHVRRFLAHHRRLLSRVAFDWSAAAVDALADGTEGLSGAEIEVVLRRALMLGRADNDRNILTATEAQLALLDGKPGRGARKRFIRLAGKRAAQAYADLKLSWAAGAIEELAARTVGRAGDVVDLVVRRAVAVQAPKGRSVRLTAAEVSRAAATLLNEENARAVSAKRHRRTALALYDIP